ncbi:MAG: tetratricopeptide repeat protein [Candidatus Acidiferrales bacterium]
MKFRAWMGVCVFLFFGGVAPRAVAQTPSREVIRHAEDPAEAESRETLAKAQAAMDKTDFAGAVQICSEYLEKNPDDAAVHFQLGYAYTALGNAPEAESEYRKATAIDPKMGPAYLNLGLTLLERRPAEAIAPLRQATELMPDQLRPKFLLGIALEQTGDFSSAIEELRSARNLDKKDFNTQLELARALLRAKNPADAEREFRAALEIQPGASAAHLGLAQTLVQEKKMAEAATELGTYLQSQPNDFDAHVQRASILGDVDKNADALGELDRAASIRADTKETLELRSVIDVRLKKYDDALVALQKIESTAPDDRDLHARIGHIYLEKKDYPGAVKELAIAFRADPSQEDVLRDLLAAQYLGGNYPAALDLLDALAKRESLSNGSWYIRATCYDKLGRKQEAIDGYRKFLDLNGGQTNDQYFAASERVRILERELKEKKH